MVTAPPSHLRAAQTCAEASAQLLPAAAPRPAASPPDHTDPRKERQYGQLTDIRGQCGPPLGTVSGKLMVKTFLRQPGSVELDDLKE